MKILHLILGFMALGVFLLTGQYMDRYYNHLIDMPDGPRLLFRSRHIYILLAALVNLGIGTYVTPRRQLWRRGLQWTGSLIITMATAMFVSAFFYEPFWKNLYTPLSRPAVYAILYGTMSHFFASLGAIDDRPEPTLRPDVSD